MILSLAKTAEPMKMPKELCIIDGGPDPHDEEKGWSTIKYRDSMP